MQINDSVEIEAHGPLGIKFIKMIRAQSQNNTTDLNIWKLTKEYQDNLNKWHKNKDLSDLDLLHAIYVDTEHYITDFIELLSLFKFSNELHNISMQAEDLYTPSSPPMSPITNSFYNCWLAFDLGIGETLESYSTIMLDVYKELGCDQYFLSVLKSMQQSRMGLYMHEGHIGKFVCLRELYTNKIIKAFVPSGYNGVKGELWFVRLLSDPHDLVFDYSIAFTTPYVIINIPEGMTIDKKILFYSEQSWLDFIERNLLKTWIKDKETAYNHFMKYGLENYYWLEYIFCGFLNFKSNVIWLTGFPDKPKTLPHSKQNRDKIFR